MRILPIFTMVSLLALVGCGDERIATGVFIAADGRVVGNSAQNTRDEAQRTINRQLEQQLGPHWRVKATIAELPEWSAGRTDSDWVWVKATVAVEVVGDGQAALSVSAPEIQQAVFAYLRPRVELPSKRLTVTVAAATDAERFAALAPKPVVVETLAATPAAVPAAVAAPAPMAVPVAAKPTGERRYVIQTGDTLGDISTAFYGSNQYWKQIRAANPTLDPNSLTVGTEIVIPALTP